MKTNFKIGTVAALAFAAVSAMAQVRVYVNNDPVNFPGQGPTMSGDRVLVPLRGVLERLGAHVDWDPSTQTVSARKAGTDVRLHIGQTDASVNGQPVTLDIPAQIINGSTMVPLRFVSEALGEDVHWDSANQSVMIQTPNGNSGDYAIPRPRARDMTVRDRNQRPQQYNQGTREVLVNNLVFNAGTVLPVSLNDQLSSTDSYKGQRFSANVQSGTAGLGSGSRVEGYVAAVRAQNGDKPGMIDLRFDRLIMQNGNSYPITGTLIGLDDKSVTRRGDRIVANPGTQTNRGVFAGYGAGAGLLVGILSKRPVEDALLGGLLGFGIGAAQKDQPSNVHLNPGQQFGVRLDQDVRVRANDIR